MSKSYDWLEKQGKKYNTLTADQKKQFIKEGYYEHSLSWAGLAELAGTYAQKIRRDGKRLGIKSKTKKEAQKAALSSGRHPHPTKDKERSEETKIKISEGMYETWNEMDSEEKERRRQLSVEIWNKKSPQEIKDFRKAAGDGVRAAAKEGSALEKFLFKALLDAGYVVEFHKEHFTIREKQHLDLFLPKMNVAIEVDGPSHFSNIWGEEVLKKNIERDRIKTGLLLDRGLCIIRVRQTKSLSKKYKRDILEKVVKELGKIKKNFPSKGSRHIILGDS